MRIEPQTTPDLHKLAELIDKIKVGMLTTYNADDKILHSRPLTTLKMDATPAIWFLTSISSPKIHELDRAPQVCLTYANGSDFVCVAGTSQLLRDRATIAELWTPLAKTWFPQSVDDPDLAALRVVVQHAEYWDAPDGTLKQLFALIAATVTQSPGLLGANVKIDPGVKPGKR